MVQLPFSEIVDELDFKTQFQRKSKFREPVLFLIACEGIKDEPTYINEFVKFYHIDQASVKIAERKPGDRSSDPLSIIEILSDNLKDIKSINIKRSIHPWILIDRDDRLKETLESAKRCCDELGYNIAFSCPCIELWFLLHYKDINKLDSNLRTKLLNSQALKKYLIKNHLDLQTNLSSMFLNTNDAIQRAKEIDYITVDFPATHCTKVYRLIEKLLELID